VATIYIAWGIDTLRLETTADAVRGGDFGDALDAVEEAAIGCTFCVALRSAAESRQPLPESSELAVVAKEDEDVSGVLRQNLEAGTAPIVLVDGPIEGNLENEGWIDTGDGGLRPLVPNNRVYLACDFRPMGAGIASNAPAKSGRLPPRFTPGQP
jgi:hypothetical protein